jgi:hypothetical protein
MNEQRKPLNLTETFRLMQELAEEVANKQAEIELRKQNLFDSIFLENLTDIGKENRATYGIPYTIIVNSNYPEETCKLLVNCTKSERVHIKDEVSDLVFLWEPNEVQFRYLWDLPETNENNLKHFNLNLEL